MMILFGWLYETLFVTAAVAFHVVLFASVAVFGVAVIGWRRFRHRDAAGSAV